MTQQSVTVEAVEARVYEALVELGPEPEEVTPDATFEALDIDSLDMVEVAQIMKQEFGIELEPEEFEGVQTVGDAVAVITAHVK